MNRRGAARRKLRQLQDIVNGRNKKDNCIYCIYKEVSTTKFGHQKLRCRKLDSIIAVRRTDKELSEIIPPEWCPKKDERRDGVMKLGWVKTWSSKSTERLINALQKALAQMDAEQLKLLEGKTIERVELIENSGPGDILYIYFTDETVIEIDAECECGYYHPKLVIRI